MAGCSASARIYMPALMPYSERARKHSIWIIILPVIFGVPWILISQLLADMIFVGLVSYEINSDADREWLGRAAGWVAATAVIWIVTTFITFAGGWFFIDVCLRQDPRTLCCRCRRYRGAIATAWIGKTASFFEKSKPARIERQGDRRTKSEWPSPARCLPRFWWSSYRSGSTCCCSAIRWSTACTDRSLSSRAISSYGCASALSGSASSPGSLPTASTSTASPSTRFIATVWCAPISAHRASAAAPTNSPASMPTIISRRTCCGRRNAIRSPSTTISACSTWSTSRSMS